jgi:hypothetical protein
VADGLGADCVNLAVGGGSNARLLRTSVSALPGLLASGVPAHDVLFVAMWTELSRTEVRGPDAARDLPDEEDDMQWKRIGRWGADAGDKQSELYYRHLQNDDGDLENFLVRWVVLDAFLFRLGVRAVYCFAWDFLPDDGFTRHPSLTAQLDEDRLLGGFQSCGEVSFGAVVRDRFAAGPGRHPLQEGHRHYAEEYLLPWLRSFW